MKVLRRRGYTVLQLLVSIGASCGVTFVVFTPVMRMQSQDKRGSCLSNLREVGLGFAQYAQDYDQRFPMAALAPESSDSPYGWADAVRSYVMTTEVFQCPSASTLTADSDYPTSPGYTDYYLNSNVSGVEQKYFALVSRTILCGDGNDGHDATNARYALNALPRSWRSDPQSPARRHLEMANYLFVDGHVRSASVVNIQEHSSDTGYQYTFAIRPNE